jgi:4-hydroxyphenylacetate decarboxylase small subunit
MAKDVKKHSDCENYAPVDVVTGICHLTNEIVVVDLQVCTKFEEVPKCRSCVFFKNPDKDGIGTCTGLNKEYWTAGNYNAGLCEGYKPIHNV